MTGFDRIVARLLDLEHPPSSTIARRIGADLSDLVARGIVSWPDLKVLFDSQSAAAATALASALCVHDDTVAPHFSFLAQYLNHSGVDVRQAILAHTGDCTLEESAAMARCLACLSSTNWDERAAVRFGLASVVPTASSSAVREFMLQAISSLTEAHARQLHSSIVDFLYEPVGEIRQFSHDAAGIVRVSYAVAGLIRNIDWFGAPNDVSIRLAGLAEAYVTTYDFELSDLPKRWDFSRFAGGGPI